ncbi:MAG: glycosyltransferase [Thermodesulfobacteriota bacterium]|nr:glycosyltransferase [Thermodesulfobacteriota bacterium]
MIRVLICGEIDPGWRQKAEIFLTRGRDEYKRGLAGKTLPQESPRLPRVYPTFALREDEAGRQLNKVNPQVIISLKAKPRPVLMMSCLDRLKWFHFDETPSPEHLKQTIYEVYLSQALFPHPGEKGQPLVSVFTPTYNSGTYLSQAYQSLTAQTYRNWEWVIIDDGSTDETPRNVTSWAANDTRIRFFRPVDRNFGNIGRMKHYASGLCMGGYLVELDHDDILTDNALAEVVAAFEADPDLGFIYSNFAEFVEGGGDHYYPNWLDRGRYRRTLYQDRYYMEALAYDVYGDVEGLGPVIKDMTICPNHIRAFRRTELYKVGGYNPRLVMGDDFDLIIRMFCHSKIKHIPKLLYLYRIHSNTWARFNEFARFFLPLVVQRWEREIDQRIGQLKKEGQWLTKVQGRRGQGSGPVI